MKRLISLLVFAGVAGAFAAGAYFTKDRWGRLVWPEPKGEETKPGHEGHDHDHAHGDRVKLTAQARRNLKLVVKPAVRSEGYWKTIPVPGVIVDRPGQSDRGVTAPITGVVTRIHAFPSDTVRPGEPLFDLRITSEFVQNAQADLFKTVNEERLQEKVVKRLVDSGGAVAEGQIVEARAQQVKLAGQTKSYRQILQSSGLTPAQIDAAAGGKFVREVAVLAPPAGSGADAGTGYEVQDLKVQLGEQVQSGQVLGTLADHRQLYIEGRGFKGEAASLAMAAENRWPVQAEFAEDDVKAWPELKQTLTIRHLANAMDRASRTFAFFVPLTNQARPFKQDGKTFLVWRFRPGQRVRLHVRTEEVKGDPVPGSPGEFTGVIVLPAAAVVREGPEAYVFRANGEAFDRKPVNVLYEDRRDVVLANDGSLSPGVFVAQNAAAALNRVLAAQKAGEGGGHGHDHAGHSH